MWRDLSWFGRLAVAVVAVAINFGGLGVIGLRAQEAEKQAKAAAKKSVKVVIDYGDGATLHIEGIAWRAKMTVLDALTAVSKHAHGVDFAFQGKQSTALVTRIGNLSNEGGGLASKNWIYRVNGEKADVGAGAMEVKAGDAILWRFETLD